MIKKLPILFCLILGLGLLTNSANAIVVNGLWGGTIHSMPAINYFGSGPQTFGPGITWTSTNADNLYGSVFGYNGEYGFGDNGDWSGSLGSMAGLNDSFYDFGVVNTMTFAFDSPVNAVGGFMNYVPNGITPTIIRVYDFSNNLIESYNLSFITGGGVDSGKFIGFWEPNAIISYFSLTDNYIGITNITVGGFPAVPLPSTLLLLGSGLLGYLILQRRSK